MAWAEIRHTCGHVVRIQQYGKMQDRSRERERLSSRPCLECARASELDKACAEASAAGLPGLAGSDKQVAWAQTIRATRMREIAALPAPTPRDLAWVGYPAYLAALDAIRLEAQAKYWIDTRDDSLRELIKSRMGSASS